MGDECLFKGILGSCHTAPPKLMRSERIEKIINASKIRGDDEITLALEEPFKNKTPTYVVCHKNCISSYVSDHNLRRFKASAQTEKEDIEPPTKKLRSSAVPFDPKLHCLYHKGIGECLIPEQLDPAIRAVNQKRNPTHSCMTKLTADG